MTCPTEPCGNDECDRCDPRPRFVLRQDSVRHVRYEVVVKAASAEEALAMFADGTCQGAEPTSYNEHDLQVISTTPALALTHEEAYPDRDHDRQLRYWREECCYHDVREATRMPDNLDEMLVALEAKPDLPEVPISQATVDALCEQED